MADKPAKAATPAQEIRRPSAQLAFKTWLANNRCTFRDLEDILRGMGYQADHTTLSRMSKEYPKWALAIAEKTAQLPPQQVLAALKEAVQLANDVAPEVYQGIKAQLVARLFMTLSDMPFPTIEEWKEGLECADRLEAFIHHERGKAISADTKAEAKGGKSIMDSLNPPIKFEKFRKNGGAS
jgi:hypothetical protein